MYSPDFLYSHAYDKFTYNDRCIHFYIILEFKEECWDDIYK